MKLINIYLQTFFGLQIRRMNQSPGKDLVLLSHGKTITCMNNNVLTNLGGLEIKHWPEMY